MSGELERAGRLFQRLLEAGDLSPESEGALVAIEGAALEIGRGLGDRPASRDLLLATVLVDDSTSVALRLDEIRRGHGLLREALGEKATSADVQMMTRAL